MTKRARLDSHRMRRNFSSHAREYDTYAAVQLRVVDRLTDLICQSGPVDGPVLEVGAGTGRLSQSLVRAFPGIRPLVSDIAHGMTCQAVSAVPGALAVDADAQALPLRAGIFSLVCSSSVFQWVERLHCAISESGRVLAPGGLFAFALFGERTLFELRESHRRAVIEVDGVHSSHVQDFPGEAEVRLALGGNGFQEILVHSEIEVEYHPDIPDLLRHLKRIGAGNAAKERPPGMSSRRVFYRMVDIYEKLYRQERHIPATYQVIYGMARKLTRPGKAE